MRPRGFVYGVFIAASVIGVGAVVATVSRSGSTALPGWTKAVRPGELSEQHAFLSGDCETCHRPYSGVQAVQCIVCHASAAVVLARPSTAFHETIGECAGCHVEHRGPGRPVRMDHAVLVAAGDRLASATSVETIAARLSRLAAEMLAAAPAVGAFRALDCYACHDARSPHRTRSIDAGAHFSRGGNAGSRFGRDCSECHETTTWRIAEYVHPPATSPDCAQCHEAPPSHYMMHFHMVSMTIAHQEHARVEQCYLCHQTDSWNNIKWVGWYKHH